MRPFANFQRLLFIGLLLALTTAPRAQAADYEFAGESSQVAFNLKHLGISTARGQFESFQGLYRFDPERVEDSAVNLKIQTSSVTSDNPKIPKLMRSKDFFFSEKYPEITFTSKRVVPVSEDRFDIHGDLTIRGKTNPAVFKTARLYKASANKHVFFETTTYISRKDFGIGIENWLNPLMAVMGESLKISLEVEGIPTSSAQSNPESPLP